MPLAPLTDEDKARLREQGKRALELLASRAPPVVVALLEGNAPAAFALLLSLAKEIGAIFGTRENAELALRELRATGVLSALQAWALGWLVALRDGPPPRIDPSDPATWVLGAPPMVLNQQPAEPQP